MGQTSEKILFHTYAFALNSIEIGVWGTTGLATRVALDIEVNDVVREGAKIAAVYFFPAAP